jgi:hypothetical protein
MSFAWFRALCSFTRNINIAYRIHAAVPSRLAEPGSVPITQQLLRCRQIDIDSQTTYAIPLLPPHRFSLSAFR